MTTRHGVVRGREQTVALLVAVSLLTGCRLGGPTERVSIANPALNPITIAVAPALNLSGSNDFDENRVADLMASELAYADGVSVIPVSRVLAAAATQGLKGVESPTHALELVELLGADAILVFAVTQYDPYDPPSIGISAQLYGVWPGPRFGAVDPTALSRQASLAAAQRRPDRPAMVETQRVFDASHGSIVAEIREFARLRGGDKGPYGWRKYVVSQQHFLRYCCHATIGALLDGRQGSGLGGVDPER